MITITPYRLPEIVPHEALQAWRDAIPKPDLRGCPAEVRDFINALADKLPDFGQIRKDNTVITGYELNLANMHTYNGQWIDPMGVYDLPVPYLVPIDNRTSMHRTFIRRGKQGLIDWVKARVKGSELERLLEILTVHVFKEERPEFASMLEKINASKKITAALNV